MEGHPFVFSPGEWLGTGTIRFSQSPDTLRYHTHWKCFPEKDGKILLRQIVEIESGGDHVVNEYTLAPKSGSDFSMELNNDLIGQVAGKGIADEKTLSWELRGDDLQGFEVYEREAEDAYLMRAEFTSDEDSRTTIEGKIWLKSTT